ncbi:BPTI/Kunitz inhibitor domain-containing protein [Plasmodiophora brassicae]|nr:hypothetical protein PBRA_000549 [Plasmodiophora brassicae]
MKRVVAIVAVAVLLLAATARADRWFKSWAADDDGGDDVDDAAAHVDRPSANRDVPDKAYDDDGVDGRDSAVNEGTDEPSGAAEIDDGDADDVVGHPSSVEDESVGDVKETDANVRDSDLSASPSEPAGDDRVEVPESQGNAAEASASRDVDGAGGDTDQESDDRIFHATVDAQGNTISSAGSAERDMAPIVKVLLDKDPHYPVEYCIGGEAQRGACTGNHTRWSFHQDNGTCRPFQYGGCMGTLNLFEKESDCMRKCVHSPAERVDGLGATYSDEQSASEVIAALNATSDDEWASR